MSARLVISTEEGVVLQLSLGRGPVTIGRAGDNQVGSTDRRTSRHHAIVRPIPPGADGSAERGYEVEDGGSTYGTFLNGRQVDRERLGHNDLLQLGGLQVQFQVVEDAEEAAPSRTSAPGPGSQDVIDLREQVRHLIETDADLRRELGRAQEAEREAASALSRAEREAESALSEAQHEAAKLRGLIAELRAEQAELKGRVTALGQELLNERSARALAQATSPPDARAAAPAPGVGPGGPEGDDRQGEKLRARIRELEGRENDLLLSDQKLRKEIERLNELNLKREKREAELMAVVKPALERVHQLTQELEKTRIALAEAKAGLDGAKSRAGGR